MNIQKFAAIVQAILEMGEDISVHFGITPSLRPRRVQTFEQAGIPSSEPGLVITLMSGDQFRLILFHHIVAPSLGLKCPLCQRGFSDQDELDDHIESNHDEP